MKTENGYKKDELIIRMTRLVFEFKIWNRFDHRWLTALNQSILMIVFTALFTILFAVFSECNAGDKDDINHPVQITYETSPVQSFSVSGDGKWLVCSLEREGFTDLWLYSADPSNVVVPKRLTNDPSYESSPSFSPDGRYIAYTGTDFDVKGDIYILDIKNVNRLPVRLTGRKTEDGGPCFGKSGSILYFHQILPGETLPKLVSIDLSDDTKKIHRVKTGTDGSDPSISPDGKKICYVSRSADQSGAIMLFDQETGETKQVTRGPFIDSAPTWSTDGNAILFSRIFLDTDKDGKFSRRDNATIFKIFPNAKKTKPFPLTIFNELCGRPKTAKGKLFFISDKNRGVGNCFSISEKGMIPDAETPELQIKFANRLRESI
ncbi:MAG: PD40 domain-containing protein, partial [Deltaproteobacteria bacterium]|nr:PD40 domain-containing protein [Deltaproteobacteria bacterium]